MPPYVALRGRGDDAHISDTLVYMAVHSQENSYMTTNVSNLPRTLDLGFSMDVSVYDSNNAPSDVRVALRANSDLLVPPFNPGQYTYLSSSGWQNSNGSFIRRPRTSSSLMNLVICK